MAVPRDVDPDVRSLKGVFLYDHDDLKAVAQANLRERARDTAAAEKLLNGELKAFLDWRTSLDRMPLVVELRRRAEDVRRDEVQRLLKRLGPLSEAQEKAIEASTSAIVNKLLHPPTVGLKEVLKSGDEEQLLVACRALGIPAPQARRPGPQESHALLLAVGEGT
jgi:glutamyl-tRNA reductase